MIREQEGGFEFSSGKLGHLLAFYSAFAMVYTKDNQTKRARQTRKEVVNTHRSAFGS